jgi:hypothetical protein
MELVKKYRPVLTDRIVSTQPIAPIPDPNETRRNAVKAVEFLDSTNAAKEGVFVVMGMGKGYFAHEVASRLDNGHIMAVYEPNTGIFKHAMSRLDLAPILGNEKVFLALGDSFDGTWIHLCHYKMLNGKLWLVRHKNFHNGDRELCDKFYEKFISEKRVADINMTTQVGLGKKFINSIMENIPALVTRDGVVSLKGMLGGKPAMVVASGPSLDDTIDHVKAAKGKMCVIAVDTALPHLLSHGVVPDIVTGIDPLSDNNALVKDARCREIPLACVAQYTPRIVKEYPGRVFIAGMPGNQIFHWLQWYWEDKGNIDCFGGSVSHFAYGLAEYMGAGDIVLVGHDYSYKSKWYCGTTSELLHSEVGLQVPDETLGAPQEKNVAGEMVYTRPTLLSFRTALENRISQFPRRVINLSPCGLPIAGTEHGGDVPSHDCDYAALIRDCRSSSAYQLEELINACVLGRDIFNKVKHYCLRILARIHKAQDARREGRDRECIVMLRRIEKMRHYAIHPLLEIMVGYHALLDIYLRRQDVQDVDTMTDEWKQREARMDRGLNYYGELNEAVGLFLVELRKLIQALRCMRTDHGVS